VSERSNRITRRRLLAGAGKTAVAGVAASTLGWIEIGNPVAASAATTGEVGAPAGGSNAFEYLGQVDQNGDALTYFGYLTAISGLDVSLLFTGATHDETTARFTFHGNATLISRAVFNNVFTIDAAGSIKCFFNVNGGASFSDPGSFRSGKLITVDDTTFQDILSVTAPNTGTPNLTAFLQRTRATRFVLEGTRYKLGHVGLLERSTATGLGTKLDPKPKAMLTIAGSAVVTGEA
jgi:hypothetical protein